MFVWIVYVNMCRLQLDSFELGNLEQMTLFSYIYFCIPLSFQLKPKEWLL